MRCGETVFDVCTAVIIPVRISLREPAVGFTPIKIIPGVVTLIVKINWFFGICLLLTGPQCLIVFVICNGAS